ncbi:MAG TPA: prepilin-type N-terminal cleavage/methylation domain-containing protein [Methylomirabilota bacterium]|nr:prepilin-type N-terminal cleavage/methylation domain-containing protein [Methylomirabilota bacterium]
MSQMQTTLRDQRGFTLTELLVVAAVLGMILAAVVLVQQQGQQAYIFGSHRVEVQQNNRAALELMVRELRSATSVTAVPSATNLTFLDENGNTIQYQISGAILNRTVTVAATATTTTTPLIGGVQTLALAYYSDWNGATNTGTTTTTPAQVKLIRLQLVTGTEDQVSSGSPGNQSATMETLVRLRNIP